MESGNAAEDWGWGVIVELTPTNGSVWMSLSNEMKLMMSTNYLMPDWDIYTEPGRSPFRECRTHIACEDPKHDDFWGGPKNNTPNPWLVLGFALLAIFLCYVYFGPKN